MNISTNIEDFLHQHQVHQMDQVQTMDRGNSSNNCILETKSLALQSGSYFSYFAVCIIVFVVISVMKVQGNI